MNEYREIVEVHPILLYTDDLRELERVIKEGFECSEDDFEVTAEFGARRVSAPSVEELVSRELSNETNSLRIEARSRKEPPTIDAGLSITMYRSFVSYQLYSDSETLFYGKRGQLDAFFESRRPWYGRARSFFAIVAPNLVLLSLIGTLAFAVRDDWLSAFLFGLTTVLLAWVSFSTYRGKLFPYVRIVLGERPTVPSKFELALAALNVIVVLSTIARILLALANK